MTREAEEIRDISDQETPRQEDSSAERSEDVKLHRHFKCESCGATVEYKPGSDVQVCLYCEHHNEIEQTAEYVGEQDFMAHLEAMEQQEELEEHLTVTCPECAAEISTEPNVTSQECPYCDSNIVATGRSQKHIKPKLLLPFKIERKQARDLFGRWIDGLWFAPSNLKQLARQDGKFNGMYVPYWTYDSDTQSAYTGERGEHYWDTETYRTRENDKWVTKTRRVRKTRWYSASGTVRNRFDDILVLASKSLPRKYAQKLEPWDLQNLMPYQDEYLSGFKAESYQVDLRQGFGAAQKIMEDPIRRSIRLDIGGDEQRIHSVRTRYDSITFKHILLPLWISAYRYKEQVYRLLVNARTGEVQGERPWSFMKIVLVVLAFAIAAAVVVLVLANS